MTVAFNPAKPSAVKLQVNDFAKKWPLGPILHQTLGHVGCLQSLSNNSSDPECFRGRYRRPILEDVAVRQVRFAREDVRLLRQTVAKSGIRHRNHRTQELWLPPGL